MTPQELEVSFPACAWWHRRVSNSNGSHVETRVVEILRTVVRRVESAGSESEAARQNEPKSESSLDLRRLVPLGLLLDQLPLGVDGEDPAQRHPHLLVGESILCGDTMTTVRARASGAALGSGWSCRLRGFGIP